MVDCLFCKIINKEINSDILFEDDDVLAFKDINPQAPIHFLIVPKKHISTINDLQQEDEKITGKMILTAQSLAKQENIDENGYRLVFNCNSDGGQEVYHIHLHLLGGRQMQWPPG
ncbi:histidine triad nucleotide-binding protein [candidate division KSB1 bacterium]|nr:histidine triad nucleotide-binding protein [candidate division KSB1 bacterium]